MHVILVHLPAETGQSINVVSARQGHLKFQHTKYASRKLISICRSVRALLIRYPSRAGTRKVEASRTGSDSNEYQSTYNGEVCDGQVWIIPSVSPRFRPDHPVKFLEYYSVTHCPRSVCLFQHA